MLTLRLTQAGYAQGQHQVEVSLEGDGRQHHTAASQFEFKLTEQEQKDLRWYLEEYLQDPHDPAPTIAARIDKRMAEIGSELFDAVFRSSDDARDLWAGVHSYLNETLVEIITSARAPTIIPWELMREPMTDTPLALHARFIPARRPLGCLATIL